MSILLKFFSLLIVLDILACLMGGGWVFSTIGIMMGVDSKDVVESFAFVEVNEVALNAISIAKQLLVVKLIFDIYRYGNGELGKSPTLTKNPIFNKLSDKKKLGQVQKL